jgi:hypothetical protein
MVNLNFEKGVNPNFEKGRRTTQKDADDMICSIKNADMNAILVVYQLSEWIPQRPMSKSSMVHHFLSC